MTNKSHHTLTRQLHKLGLDERRLPDALSWSKFLNIIEKTYHDADIERVVLDRSLAISSDEMQSAYLREKLTHEARLRAVFNSTQDLIWLKDPEGVYLACNPMFEIFFGASASEIVGKRDYDFVDKTLADFFLRHDRAVIEKQGPCSNEEWLTFAGNQYRGLFETVKTPIYDDAGQLMGVMGVARDITERKRIAESIKAHEQQLSYVLDATGEGIWDWDINSGVFSHNSEWCKIAGLDDGYLSHALNVFAGILHEEDRDLVFEKLNTCLAGNGLYQSEHRFRRANDEIVWILDRGKVVERDASGVPVRMVGSAVDITHRKSIENKLLREIRKSEGLLKAASDGLHIMDAKGNLVQVSDSFCRMLGYSRDEMLGMNVLQWNVNLHSVQEFEERLQQLPPGGLVFETQQRRRDGKIIDVEISSVYVAIGEDRFVYASAQDISERKSAERLLIDREAKLAAILDNLPFMIWLKNVSGEYVAVNQPYVRAVGKNDTNEVIGKTDFELWPSELAEKFVSDDALVMESRQQKSFEEMSFDYGQDTWVETYKTPIIDAEGRLLGTTGILPSANRKRKP
jgi:PAS domain S-box-containing protein